MPVEKASDQAAFFDPKVFGVAAIFRPTIGAAVPVNLLVDLGDDVTQVGELSLRVRRGTFEFLVDDVPDPRDRDRIEISAGRHAGTYELQGVPQAEDAERVSWLAQVHEVPAP